MVQVKYPSWHLKKTPLFHMSHIDNFPSILEAGYLRAKNDLTNSHRSIANEEIQVARANKEVKLFPYGLIHDYIPFYFAPRSPMLYQNWKGGLPNATSQENIIYFVAYAQTIHENQIPYTFYDRHPMNRLAECYNDIKDLERIEWDVFYEPPLEGSYARFWHFTYDDHVLGTKRKTIRQAEFLVHKELDLQYIAGIGTMTEEVKDKALGTLTQFNNSMPVKVKKDWYFMMENS